MALLPLLMAEPRVSSAAPPPGYYDSVDATDAVTLRATLHPIIDDHIRFPYTSGSTDTWNILELADEDPTNPANILDIYRNRSFAKQGGGNSFYNREHSWPKSYGFPNLDNDNYPYTDCFQLFLCDSGYNSARSNKPFRNCTPSCSEWPTDVNNGQGGGSGTYPGNSNWTSGSFTQGTWETWSGRRGDIARAQFYLDIRYEGGTHGTTGSPEPDLILTDNEALIDASRTGSNEPIAYMGILSVLLQWHAQDPVDDGERLRNDIVFSFQGNRNPFIDHPEWAGCLFQGVCGGGGDPPPAAPAALVATPDDTLVNLDWADNVEPDLDGYNVYRATVAGGPYAPVNGALVGVSLFSDNTVTNDVTYYYVVTALDTAGQESANSNEAVATPSAGGGGPGQIPWINEFHYDNSGTDTGEFVEIAGSAGTNLTNWTLIGYNGNGGAVYQVIALTGTIPDQQGCMGTLSFGFLGLQNGAPDGLALVDPTNTVVQFISYEGAFTATAGVAAGMTSVDIGVSEQPPSQVGESLQLSGIGSQGADFAWQSPAPETRGATNGGQVFDGCGGDTTPPAAPTGLLLAGGNGLVSLDWTDNTEPDLMGYNVHRSTMSGGPYAQINSGLVGPSDFIDNAVLNCTTYYYVVTAVDNNSNESADSTEAGATPSPSGGTAGDCDGNGIPDDCQPDSDGDGVIDACDGCPSDPDKIAPGVCGCGIPETSPDGDMDGNGNVDGSDIKLFVDALLGGNPATHDLCHGDFDGNQVLDEGDIPGMVNALLPL